MPAEIGQPAPDFTLPDGQNNPHSLSDLRGSKAIIVFIPFPYTGICQGELCAIRDDISNLEGLGAKVVAIGCDSRSAIRHWVEENNIQYPILSDFWPHGAVTQAYGCFNEASGGAFRSSFVLDPNGVVRAIIKTDVTSHAREHAEYAKALAAI